MGYALLKSRQPYRLHIRCQSCTLETSKLLEVPEGAPEPSDPDEVIDGGYLEKLQFSCSRCESLIGTLVGISGGSCHDQ